MKFDTKKHESINSNGYRDLPKGKGNYVITKMVEEKIKADKTGKRKHIVVTLRSSKDGNSYNQYFETTPKDRTENEKTRAEIAANTVADFLRAANGGKDIAITKASDLKKIYDKEFGVEVTERQGSNGKSYLNITRIEAAYDFDNLDADEDADEEEAEDQDTPAEEEAEDEESEAEEEAEDEEEGEEEESDRPW